MRDLKTTLIQTELIWEDIESNLALMDQKIDTIRDETDLIILPEMFTTGFSMNTQKLAQDMNGSTVNWISKKSKQKGSDIVGSAMIEAGGKYYNRLLWARPGGDLLTYDKKHLFRMLGEDKVYSSGDRNITVNLNGWKIRPLICYDLRFPAWSRNIENRYDLAIYIANWPAKRSGHWKALVKARAIENQCFVIGVNRIGTDGNGNPHSGDSSIINPLGETIFQKADEAVTHTASLSYSVLQSYREEFPAWMDADSDIIVMDY